MRRAAGLLAALALALAATGDTAGAATAPAMRFGFSDLATMQRGNVAEQPLELEHLKATGAGSLRIMWQWAAVERQRPADDASATDPGFAGYDFTALDTLLRNARAAGVEPLLMIGRAPRWWEGADRPPAGPSAPPAGTWKPDAAAYGRFMTAAARRYSGSYPDPLQPGATLPRVRDWQIWNEPNLYVELNPQWTYASGRWRTASPGMYRALLNAGYDAVKSVRADNTVVTAGTAPFGDPAPGGQRIMPARFLRELLCVKRAGAHRYRASNCRRTPARFDVLAHHPYPIGPPGRTAINADDVVVPDFAKLQEPLRVAIAAGNVYPRRPKPVWATEMSWDSSPPDPGGIPALQQAHYLAGAIYVLWRQGVRALFWWNLRDDARGRGFIYTLQSGVYFRGATVAQDTPKPSFTAMRFPFVAYRPYANFRGFGQTRLWGMAPRPGEAVSIQIDTGRAWRTIKAVRAGADRVFQLRVQANRGARFRAVQSGRKSIDAKVF